MPLITVTRGDRVLWVPGGEEGIVVDVRAHMRVAMVSLDSSPRQLLDLDMDVLRPI